MMIKMRINLIDETPDKTVELEKDLLSHMSEYKTATVEPPQVEPEPEQPELSQPSLEKRGRGRPKGSLKNGTITKAPTQNEPVVIKSQLISGYIFLSLIDVVIPAAFSAVYRIATKKKIDVKKMKLSEEQKKELQPSADEVAKIIELSPVAAFSLSILALYATNLMSIQNDK